MKIRNPVLYGLFFIFLVLNIVDLMTAKDILSAEANPVYLLFGSFWALIIIKLVFIIPAGLIIFKNNYPGHITNYLMISYFVFGSLLMLFAIFTNVQVGKLYNQLNETQQIEVNEKLSEASKTEKVQFYFTVVGFNYFAPLILSLVCFVLYRWNLRYSNIDKKYNKFKYWWKDE